VGGGLRLEGYEHQLPAGLTSVGGGISLTGYKHPLPAGLTSVGGLLSLEGYKLPLPAGLTSVGGGIYLHGYPHPLPAGLTHVGGKFNLRGYSHPLPAGLTSVGGDLDLDGYKLPLPAGLTSVGGDLDLDGYKLPLPAGLTSVVGGIYYLTGYPHPLPAGLTHVGGKFNLRGYSHPLPAALATLAAQAGWEFNGQRWGARAVREHYEITPPASPEFRSWLGKSRAVDDSGTPVLLYHGTPSGGFTAFDPAKADPHHPGFYFTNDLAVANTYFGIAGDIEDPTPSLDGTHPATSWGAYRVWVRMENPFVFDAEGANWNRMMVPEYPKLYKTYEVAHAAKRDGYDGCIFRNVRDSGGKTGYGKPADVYVIFSPTQIKSALFNDGSFSLTDPDIRKNPRRTSKRKTSRRKTSRGRG
jgi:hypothetical protein